MKESEIRDYLANKLNGKVEVPIKDQSTYVGRIDILTDSMIIEVKNVSNWMHAKGQLDTYCTYFKDKKRAICLFGETDINKYLFIQKDLHTNNIFLIPINLKVDDYVIEPISNVNISVITKNTDNAVNEINKILEEAGMVEPISSVNTSVITKKTDPVDIISEILEEAGMIESKVEHKCKYRIRKGARNGEMCGKPAKYPDDTGVPNMRCANHEHKSVNSFTTSNNQLLSIQKRDYYSRYALRPDQILNNIPTIKQRTDNKECIDTSKIDHNIDEIVKDINEESTNTVVSTDSIEEIISNNKCEMCNNTAKYPDDTGLPNKRCLYHESKMKLCKENEDICKCEKLIYDYIKNKSEIINNYNRLATHPLILLMQQINRNYDSLVQDHEREQIRRIKNKQYDKLQHSKDFIYANEKVSKLSVIVKEKIMSELDINMDKLEIERIVNVIITDKVNDSDYSHIDICNAHDDISYGIYEYNHEVIDLIRKYPRFNLHGCSLLSFVIDNLSIQDIKNTITYFDKDYVIREIQNIEEDAYRLYLYGVLDQKIDEDSIDIDNVFMYWCKLKSDKALWELIPTDFFIYKICKYCVDNCNAPNYILENDYRKYFDRYTYEAMSLDLE